MTELRLHMSVVPFGPAAAIVHTEIARSIAEAKGPETKNRRLTKALEELHGA